MKVKRVLCAIGTVATDLLCATVANQTADRIRYDLNGTRWETLPTEIVRILWQEFLRAQCCNGDFTTEEYAEALSRFLKWMETGEQRDAIG